MNTLKKYALLSFQHYDVGQNLKSVLEQSGFLVHITVGGLEALKLLYRSRFTSVKRNGVTVSPLSNYFPGKK